MKENTTETQAESTAFQKEIGYLLPKGWLTDIEEGLSPEEIEPIEVLTVKFTTPALFGMGQTEKTMYSNNNGKTWLSPGTLMAEKVFKTKEEATLSITEQIKEKLARAKEDYLQALADLKWIQKLADRILPEEKSVDQSKNQ